MLRSLAILERETSKQRKADREEHHTETACTESSTAWLVKITSFKQKHFFPRKSDFGRGGLIFSLLLQHNEFKGNQHQNSTQDAPSKP